MNKLVSLQKFKFRHRTINQSNMKTKKLWGILMLFLCTLNLTGCNNEDEEDRQITDYKEYLLTVASQQIPGVGWSDGFNYLTDVYAVKKEQSAEWESLSFIEGFEFEEGYEYEIRISETSYLDHRMSQPAWTEYQLLEILSKEKKDSEDLPGNFIPAWYYKDKFIPEYSYAIDADDKETIEKNLKSNPVMPLDNHYLIYFYGEGLSKWVIIDNTEQMQGKGILKQVNKNPEEFPESYKLLPLSGKGSISGYMEWTFLDESENETSYPPFDVFLVRGAQTKSENTTYITPYLYLDLTEYYQKQYPQAGVRTVVVSYAIPMVY